MFAFPAFFQFAYLGKEASLDGNCVYGYLGLAYFVIPLLQL